MSGVRNLRAMFENKDATSPPDRGRSPGESTGDPSTGTSPRPLSKVRTNFVTVERNGNQLGLKRDTSGEPSMTKRRTSFSIDEADRPKETVERKEPIAAEMEARKQSTAIEEVIPETAVETPPLEAVKIPKAPKESEKEPVTEPQKAESTMATPATNGHVNGSAQPAAVANASEKITTSKTATKQAPISTAWTNTAPEAAPSPKKLKSPPPKTPTTPNRTQPKEPTVVSENKPEKKPEKKPSRAALQPSRTTKPASKPPTAAAHGSVPKTRIPASPPQTGFHKPRPKSPTRPVKLPASLTAHTASSGSKTATAAPPAGRQSLSRASGNVQPPNNLDRSSSRASTAASKPIARSTSTLMSGSTRPSFGPPPTTLKKQPSRQSLPPAPTDDSFLARMMRPTTASASKTAEKTPVTPPKPTPTVKRPATKDGTAKHQEPKLALATQKKEASPAKIVHRANPVAKAEPKTTDPKVSSPAKKVEKVAVEPVLVEKKNEAAPEASKTQPETLPAMVEPTANKASEADIKSTEAEAPNSEEPTVEKSLPVPEVKNEEVAAEIPSTPVKSETPAEAEETIAVPEKDLSTTTESPAATKEPVEDATPANETPVAIEATPTQPAEPKPAVSEPLASPKQVPTEDPEDIKVREEIAKLNAELLKGIEETA